MRSSVLFLGFLALLSSEEARGENLWDGKWDIVPALGHAVAHTFTVQKLGDGTWRYDSGYVQYVLDPSGRAIPEPLSADYTVVTRKISDQGFSFEERLAGVPQDIVVRTLSADGRRLDGTTSSVAPGAERSTRITSAVRVGAGGGLQGRWSEPAAAAHASAPHAYWVISSDPDGSMTWTIPATGETLKGRADGRQHPLTGPGQPPGKTFRFVKLSPRHLLFSALERGHVVLKADDTLSADGRRWTEWTWTPKYPAEKDLRVFERK